jgi:DNA-binding transcriptional LysR family regulator
VDNFGTQLAGIGGDDVEIKQLRRFLAVIDYGSFAAAAPKVGLTQQALGASISNLEKELGVLLLDRGPGGLTSPTAYGSLLVAHAKAILASSSRAREELHAFRDARGGSVRLGIGETFAPEIIAEAVRDFHRDRPDVTITLVEDYTEALLPRLEQGDLDFVAGSDVGGPDTGLLKFPIYACQDIFIARAAHPLAGYKNLTLKHLQAYSWMAPRSRPADAALINEAFARAGLSGPSRFVWTDAPTVGTHLLMMDDFIFMTSPAMVMGRLIDRDNAIVVLDIKEPRVERRATLIYPATTRLNPSAMLLMEAIRTLAHRQVDKLGYATPLNVESELGG